LREFLQSNRSTPGFFEPFDDLLLHPMFLDNPIPNQNWIERLFPGECELLEATLLPDGNAHSKWHWIHGELDFEIEITHAKRYGYLPTEVRYTSKIQVFPHLHGLTRIEWGLSPPAGSTPRNLQRRR
jgi:hypothetical protein